MPGQVASEDAAPASPAGRLGCALAAAALLVLVAAALRAPYVAAPGRAAILIVALGSCWRPDYGLAALAAILPMAAFAGRSWNNTGFQWPHAFTIAFGCGFFVHRAIWRRSVSDSVLRTAAAVMGAVAVAALAVDLGVLEARVGGAAFRAELGDLLAGDFFIVNRAPAGAAVAALLVEGIIVFYAAGTIARASPPFRRLAPRALVAGAVAAAFPNLWRLAAVAGGSGHAASDLVRLLGAERINEAFSDLNAAGSYFGMTAAIAIVLALGPSVWWSISALLVLISLWITGSRAAIVAGLAAATLLLPLARPRAVSRRAAIGAAIVATAIAIAGVAFLLPERGNQKSSWTALHVRAELAEAAWRMTTSHPLFGIGAGNFYQRSGEFASPELLQIFPPARNENAHNNYLQILAELGVTGFAAFLWVLGLTWTRGVRLLRSPDQDRVRWGLAAGVLTFAISCLGGHPLIVPDIAATFWIAAGLIAGWGGAVSVPAAVPPRRLSWLTAAAVLTLAATLPARTGRALAESNLEHFGIGLSLWHHAEDGTRYREMNGIEGAVFVPADAGSCTIPLRAARANAAYDVELRLDGRRANVLEVTSSEWTNALVVMPRHDGTKFRKVDLRVLGEPPDAGPMLLVGKVIPH